MFNVEDAANEVFVSWMQNMNDGIAKHIIAGLQAAYDKGLADGLEGDLDPTGAGCDAVPETTGAGDE